MRTKILLVLLVSGLAFGATHAKKKAKPKPFLMENPDWGPVEVMDPKCEVLGNGYILYHNADSDRYGIAATCAGAITDSLTIKFQTKHRI